MAVRLRLKRMGKKRQPIYKVVAADSRYPRDGKFIEAIGSYNPKTHPATIEIAEDRALYWLGVGAKPTDTVKNLLSKKGILFRRELISRGLSEEQIEAQLSQWESEKNAKLEAMLVKEKESKAKSQKKPEPKVEEATTEASVESAASQDKIEESASEVKGAASDEAATEEKE